MKTSFLTLLFCITIISIKNIYKTHRVRQNTINVNKSIIIPFNGYQLEFTPQSEELEAFEEIRIGKDTLFIYESDITELESITIKDLNPDAFNIKQMYQSSLIAQFDGKAFEMKDWKSYKSEWFDISNGESIKIYSKEENEKFPKYSKEELIKALEINKKTLSEQWYNYIIENLDKEEPEVFFEPIITKTVFKIQILEKEVFYVQLEHMIGC